MIHHKLHKSTARTMDLRIDAKKFDVAPLSEIDAFNQMSGCPTPPPSDGSNPRTPDSLSSCTASRSNSVDDKTSPTQAVVQQKPEETSKSPTSPQTVSPPDNQKEKTPPSTIPKLVFHPIDNYSEINGDKFISIDKEQFHNNKRLRVQTEDDLLKYENSPKKHKPANFQNLSNTLISSRDNELLSFLKSALGNKNIAPLAEKHASLGWLSYLAKLQSENKENGIRKDDSSKGTVKQEQQEGDNPETVYHRLGDIMSLFINSDFNFVFKMEDNMYLDYAFNKVKEQKGAPKAEETPSQSPTILQDSNGQLYVPLQHSIDSIDLTKYQVQPVTFVNPVSDERVKSVPEPAKPHGVSSESEPEPLEPHAVSSEKLKSVPEPVMPQEVSNEQMPCLAEPEESQKVFNEKVPSLPELVESPKATNDNFPSLLEILKSQLVNHEKLMNLPELVKLQAVSDKQVIDEPLPITPEVVINVIGEEVANKYPAGKPMTPPVIAALKEVEIRQNPAPKLVTPPSKSKTIEQEFAEKYPHLLECNSIYTAPRPTVSPLIAQRNREESARNYPYPSKQTPPNVKVYKVYPKNYSPPIANTNVPMQSPAMAPPTLNGTDKSTPEVPEPKPKIDMKLANMLPHLASYNPDLFVPKLITDLTGRPIKQEFVNMCNPNPIEPKAIVPEPPKTARQKLEAKFPLMAEYHRQYLMPQPSEQEVTAQSPYPAEPLPLPPVPMSPSTTNSIGHEVAEEYPHPAKHNPDLYVIGPNGSTMSKAAWATINWTQTPAAITRKVLMCLFDKYTLATHNLSGRPSPAFKGIYKMEKLPLHPGKVADTVSIVTSRVNVTPKEVRMAITTKCADECKMLRLRQEKKAKLDAEFLKNLELQQMQM